MGLSQIQNDLRQPPILYSIGPRDGIFKQRQVWRRKGKHNEHNADNTDSAKGKPRSFTSNAILFEKHPFQKKGQRRRYKEYGNVKPIGRLAESSVIGVKQHGYKQKPCKNAQK